LRERLLGLSFLIYLHVMNCNNLPNGERYLQVVG